MSLEVTDKQIVYQRRLGLRWFSGLATPFIAALFASMPFMIMPSAAWFQDRSPLDIVGFSRSRFFSVWAVWSSSWLDCMGQYRKT